MLLINSKTSKKLRSDVGCRWVLGDPGESFSPFVFCVGLILSIMLQIVESYLYNIVIR